MRTIQHDYTKKSGTTIKSSPESFLLILLQQKLLQQQLYNHYFQQWQAQRSPSHNRIITPTRTSAMPFASPWPPTPQSPPFHGFEPPSIPTSPPFHGFRTPIPSPPHEDQDVISPPNQSILTPHYRYLPDETDALMPTPTADVAPPISVQSDLKYFPPSPIDSPPTPADVLLPPPLQRYNRFHSARTLHIPSTAKSRTRLLATPKHKFPATLNKWIAQSRFPLLQIMQKKCRIKNNFLPNKQ